MCLIHAWLKIKEDRIGYQEKRINLFFPEVEHNLFMEQINTWIRYLRLAKFNNKWIISYIPLIFFHFQLGVQMIPDIAFGQNVRVALDIGCGVASFGAFLLDRNVSTLSIAPKDVHENQIQFALERGVPAMIAVFGTHRLLYPSQAFDLVHCSRCRINWTRDGRPPICH